MRLAVAAQQPLQQHSRLDGSPPVVGGGVRRAFGPRGAALRSAAADVHRSCKAGPAAEAGTAQTGHRDVPRPAPQLGKEKRQRVRLARLRSQTSAAAHTQAATGAGALLSPLIPRAANKHCRDVDALGQLERPRRPGSHPALGAGRARPRSSRRQHASAGAARRLARQYTAGSASWSAGSVSACWQLAAFEALSTASAPPAAAGAAPPLPPPTGSNRLASPHTCRLRHSSRCQTWRRRQWRRALTTSGSAARIS